jgi:putative flippase GtrA
VSRFARFCLVGTLGFVIDAGVLQALVSGAAMDPYLARVPSFLAAATATWWLNRRFTFGVGRAATRREWASYVALMVLGAAVNYGTYAVLIGSWDVARAHLWMAVAAGSVAGLGVNFATSRRLFAASRPPVRGPDRREA